MIYSTYSKKGQEIKCLYNKLGYNYNYMREHPEKRYCILAPQDCDKKVLYQQLKFVANLPSDYTVGCNDFKLVKELIADGYKAFFNLPIADWESFNNFRELGVSDIYIDGVLGFSFDKIQKAKGDIKIRVCPNHSANTAFSIGNNITSFFIRPEDMKIYEPYIDVVDFRNTDMNTQDYENTLVDIYQRGSFNHEIKYLIKSVDLDVVNSAIYASFGQYRLNCQQKCMIPGRICRICEKSISIGDALTEAIRTGKLY